MEESSYRVEVSNILEKAKKFDTQLQNLKVLNKGLIDKSESIVTALNKIVSQKMNNRCTVCYTRERKVVLVPCGHCFCRHCSDRATSTLSRNRCFTCRAAIENSYSIYL